MKFDFRFGKRKASLKTIVILTLLVAVFAGIFKVEETKIWDIVYETILYFDPNSPLIPELQKDPGIIERKAERTVDEAVREYEDLTGDTGEVTIPESIYVKEEAKPENKTGDAGILGSPVRLCAPWIDDCPKE